MKKKFSYKKSDCHIHATLEQQLEAVHNLRFHHGIKILCKVLGVNRSTYSKHYNSKLADRAKENQYISMMILQTYADYNKRLGSYKIIYVLQRDYFINISVGRMYQLSASRAQPKMSKHRLGQ